MKTRIFPHVSVMVVVLIAGTSPLQAGKYKPKWDSLTRHPDPQWFADAKFGIYFHWGPYSVPAYKTEWYSHYIEIGVDTYNPLEVKAGMDAVELRRQYGHKMGFCGGSDIQVWETGDQEAIRKEVLRTLNAAKGGGMIFQSDHSVSVNVSGHTYDFIVKLVWEYGKYPLQLGKFDEVL